MFNIFALNPTKKLRKKFNQKLEQAMHAQRAGDIRKYSELTEQAEALRIKLEKAETDDNKNG